MRFRWMLVRYFAAICLAAFLVGAAWLSLTPAPKGVPILEYHMTNTVTDEGSYPYNVPPEELAAQLDYLQEQGYTTITVLEFIKARKGKMALPEKPIILTFDDGYEDNYLYMLPLLEERGMKATLYMSVNIIGDPEYLSWDELRDMQNRGIEIGNHTANHLPMVGLPPERLEEEIKTSKLLMEWNGIHTVLSFSYPNGMYDERLVEYLEESEYVSAVTGDPGLNTFQTNPYLLQRVNIPHPHFGILEFRWRLWKAELYTRLGIRQHIQK